MMATRTCLECGAAFVPRKGSQVCCSDECQKVRRKRLEANRCRFRDQKHERAFKKDLREKARRRAAFFAARDAAFERAGLPIPKIEIRDGVVTERRGMCVGTAAGTIDTSNYHAKSFI